MIIVLSCALNSCTKVDTDSMARPLINTTSGISSDYQENHEVSEIIERATVDPDNPISKAVSIVRTEVDPVSGLTTVYYEEN